MASEDFFNENRIIIGNFWVIDKQKKICLGKIRNEKKRKILNFGRKSEKSQKNGKIEIFDFFRRGNIESSGSDYKLRLYDNNNLQGVEVNFIETPKKKKTLFSPTATNFPKIEILTKKQKKVFQKISKFFKKQIEFFQKWKKRFFKSPEKIPIQERRNMPFIINV